MSKVFNIREHVIDASHIREYARGTATSQEEPLKLHIKEYVPRNYKDPQKGDLTIIGLHGNGFPKETYEPLWEDLIPELRKRGIRVRAIWAADATWQGKSGILNRQNTGDDPGWHDFSRDVQLMINTFRMPRPIMGIGHSLGAGVLVNVSLSNPRLLSSLVLIEPVLEQPVKTSKERYTVPAWLCAMRRDKWPSREAASQSFRKSNFYIDWDPRALDCWIEHGLIDDPDREAGSKEVTLATSKHQETFIYQRPSFQAFGPDGVELLDRDAVPDMDHEAGDNAQVVPVYRPEMATTFDQLKNVRPSVLYIFSGKSYMSTAPQREEKLRRTGIGRGGSGGRAAGRVECVVGTQYSHQIPFQAPGFCAEAAADWAVKSLERWRKEEEEFEAWTKKSLKEKSSISKEVLAKMKPDEKVMKAMARPKKTPRPAPKL